jgi:hypothetical protein
VLDETSAVWALDPDDETAEGEVGTVGEESAQAEAITAQKRPIAPVNFRVGIWGLLISAAGAGHWL